MILMKTVLVLSVIGIQFAAMAQHLDAEEEHYQDAEDIEDLKQLVNRLTLRQNNILQGLIKSVEKQSSKINGAKEDVIQRIKYEVLREAIEEVESLRELGLGDLDIEEIQWVTAKLSGATTEERAIGKVLKGMSNQDLKALKKNIDGKILHQDETELLGVLEEMDDEIDNKASRMPIDQQKVLDVLEDMDEDELEAFIENINENEDGDRHRNQVFGILEGTSEEDLGGIINKVYDEDIEQVMGKMSDNELKVVLKNVEDQELGELVTSMNDQDFNKVMRNLKGDTEEISMVRDIVKIIQSEELDTLTHQKLEQHSKEISQSRKRRDLNDILGENIEKNRSRREIEEGFQEFPSADVLSTIAGHHKIMANIVQKEKESRERKRRNTHGDHATISLGSNVREVFPPISTNTPGDHADHHHATTSLGSNVYGLVEKEKKSRKRKRRAADLLEKQKSQLRWEEADESFKETTFLEPNFESEAENEERKKSAGYIGLLSLYEHSRKRRHAIKDEGSDGIESLATRDRQKRNLDWLFSPDTTINSLIGHQPQPDHQPEPEPESVPEQTHEHQAFLNPFSKLPNIDHDFLNPFTKLPNIDQEFLNPFTKLPNIDQDFLNPFTKLPNIDHDFLNPFTKLPNLDQDFLNPFTLLRREPHSYPESETTYSEPKITDESQWMYYEPKPTHYKPQAIYEPQPEPEPSYHQPEPEPEPEPEPTHEHEPTPSGEPTCTGPDPTCHEPQTSTPQPLTTCDGSDPSCLKPQPICDESDPTCNEPQPNSPPEMTDEEHEPQPTPSNSTPQPQPICDESDPTCNEPLPNSPPETTDEESESQPTPSTEPQTTCDGSDPSCIEPQPNSTTDEESPTTCDKSDPTCVETRPTCDGSDPTCIKHEPSIPAETTDEEPKPTCDLSDPTCQESEPNSPLEDTHDDHDDHDDHHHHHTTISLGSNVYELVSPTSRATTADTPYRTSAETLTLTENNGLFLQNEEYSVPQSDRKNNAPNKPTIHVRQHSKPLNSHMDTLKSVKMGYDAAPIGTPSSWSTFREKPIH